MKTLAVGIDGGEWDVINPLLERGELPNLASLVSNGVSGPLESITPPVSPPAWTSIQTGTNPGKHGIFDFITIEPDYTHRSINASDRRAPPFWRILNDGGVSTGLFKMPFSYPPNEVDGFVVTGFPTPDSVSDFARPSSLADRIGSPSELFEDWSLQHQGKYEAFRDNIHDVAIRQTDLILDVLDDHDPEFLMTVFDGCDRIQHFYWRHYDKDHPLYEGDAQFSDAIPEHYRVIDEQIGRLLDRSDDEADVVLISDHGFGPLVYDVYVEEWLAERGYLQRRDRSDDGGVSVAQAPGLVLKRLWTVAKTLGLANTVKQVVPERVFAKGVKMGRFVDWGKTQAFFTSVSGQAICINLRDIYEEGVVTRSEYDELVGRLVADLEELRHSETGERIVREVHRTDEIFEGDAVEDAPNLIIETDPRYTLKSGQSDDVVTYASQNAKERTGDHRRDGIFVGSGPSFGVGEVEGLSVMDIAPLLLYLHDCDIPRLMDGEVPTRTLADDLVVRREVAYTDEYYEATRSGRTWTEEEQEHIEDQLKDMGYMD